MSHQVVSAAVEDGFTAPTASRRISKRQSLVNGFTAVQHHLAVMTKDKLFSYVKQMHEENNLQNLLTDPERIQSRDSKFLSTLKNLLDDEALQGQATRSPRTFLYAVLFECDNWRFDEKRKESRKFEWMDICLLLLLSLMYVLCTPARGHINSITSLLAVDPNIGYSVVRHGQVMFFGIIAVAAGKLLTGFFLDIGNPLRWIFAFLLTSAVSVLVLSHLHNIYGDDTAPQDLFPSVIALHAINLFAQCGLLASTNRFLHDHFRPAQYGRSLAIIAIGGRVGSLISGLIMGSYVDTPGATWMEASLLASCMCFASIIPLCLVMLFPHPADHLAHVHEAEYLDKLGTHNASSPPKQRLAARDQWAHLKLGIRRYIGWFRSRSFLLICIANAGMAVTITGEGFDGFISMFTRKALFVDTGFGVALVSIFLHIGAIVSLLLGGSIIEALNRPSQARMVLALMALGCVGLGGLSAATLTLVRNDDADRVCFFCIGMGFGYPYYVVVSKFALHYGGEHAAMVTQTIALFGYAVCAVVVTFIGVIVLQEDSWYYVIVMLLVFGIVGWFAMFVYNLLEWQKKAKNAQDRVYRLIVKHLFIKQVKTVAHRFDSAHFHHIRTRERRMIWSVLATGFMFIVFMLAFIGLGVSLEYTSGAGFL